MAGGGTSSEPSTAIAQDLGITVPQFDEGRRHTLTCSYLAGYVVAYRGRNKEIVLLDPADAALVIRSLVNDRTDPMFAGWRRLRHNYRVVQERMTAIVETASTEALTKGDKPVADALGYAARDIQVFGDVQPATAALLRTLGMTA
jgi:hypothetical protein